MQSCRPIQPARARDEGLITGIGLSNINHEHLVFALERPEIVCVQSAFSLTDRSSTPLAWTLSVAPSVLLIPGTSSVRHLEENVAAARIELDADTRRQLDS